MTVTAECVQPADVDELHKVGLITYEQRLVWLFHAERLLYRPPPEPEPVPGFASEADRIEAVIRQCSSGAPAFFSIRRTILDVRADRVLPPPPTGAIRYTIREMS